MCKIILFLPFLQVFKVVYLWSFKLYLMKTDSSIETKIIRLISSAVSDKITDIKKIQMSGSSRLYFRIFTDKKTYIGTYNSNTEENHAFFTFTEHFKDKGLAVPEIIATSDDKQCYIQSDMGDVSLFDYVNKCVKNGQYDDETIDLYKESIDNLIEFQIKGNEGLDYSVAFPTAKFDKSSITDDLNYFKYYFLKINEEINFNETRLNRDFQELADFLEQAPSDFFMYRDFQSRNIMIKDGHTFFIDYQGGRKGPLQYDVISLLYQVKAQIPDSLRKELLSHYKVRLSSYIDLNEIQFDKYYKAFVLIRLMQVLGAYGFRGLIQKKQHFIESIPFALRELIVLSHELDLPLELKELNSVLKQLGVLLTKYQTVKDERLTITINSFSYKNGGIPEDRSGNGGGFVFDCRSMPNPGRYQEFKTKTGEDIEVQDYLNDKEEVHHFIEMAESIISQAIDNYIQRDFKNLFVNFGCTGGQHRSVFFAKKMAEKLHEKYPDIRIVLNHIVQHKNYIYE